MSARMLLSALLALLLPATLHAQDPCFDGTGGPGGDFDWVVRTGDFFIFDTTSTDIVGGPNGLPTATEHTVNGVVDVRNLIVEPGGTIRVQGPNHMRIVATGEVVIRGTLDLSGFNARDVATLNTGNLVESGGAGCAAGGKGGNANTNTSGHTLRGGRGQGPFGQLDTGGQGGESAVAPPSAGKDGRRPGGGGGGRFARDQGLPADGLAATAGHDGSPQSVGAESGLSPARGGEAGIGPFVDPKPSNDYFGLRPLIGRRGQLIGLLRGELPGLWAGHGGGGGGNAIPATTFPNPNWNFSSDEKGGAGGGGAGALHVQALGRIVFGAQGLILSRGGFGGTGENTNFLDHVGGTGGGGSGGHVVLETASAIDFTDGGTSLAPPPLGWVQALGRPVRIGPTVDVNACCRAYSNGGASGPGVVQLHVPNPVAEPGTNPVKTDIVVPASVAAARFPLQLVASPGAVALFPTCDPFAPLGQGWFGAAGAGARASFVRLALDSRVPAPPGLLGLDVSRLLIPFVP